MKVIIIEDEKLASNRLKKLIAELRPEYHCMVCLDSIESAVTSLPPLKPDLIFIAGTVPLYGTDLYNLAEK